MSESRYKMKGRKGFIRRKTLEVMACFGVLAGCIGFTRAATHEVRESACLEETVEQGERGQRWGFTNDLGICFSQNNPWRRISLPSRDALRMARQNNMDILEYIFYWDKIEPARGTFFWDHPDEALSLAREEGFEISAKVMWAPRWATGGVPWDEAWYWSQITKGCRRSSNSTFHHWTRRRSKDSSGKS